jgi:hypothetical protein
MIDLPLLDLSRRDDLDPHGGRKTFDRDTAKRHHVLALRMQMKALRRSPLFDEHELDWIVVLSNSS